MTSSFTAHNVRLDDGSYTIAPERREMPQYPWFKSAKRALTLAFPDGLAGRRIVDLGCLEGGYTAEFARLGMDALGIEARKNNYDNCLVVKRGVALGNLNFAHDTVWNLPKYGAFDAVFCCGLLYHLDRPREFIRLASGVCKKICLYQTHFATREEPKRRLFHRRKRKFSLSEVSEHEGLAGRWYGEHRDETEAEREAKKWASWENQRSFWPMREELVGAIHENGFDMVFEQYDCLPAPLAETMTSGYYRTDTRCLFVGVRTGIA